MYFQATWFYVIVKRPRRFYMLFSALTSSIQRSKLSQSCRWLLQPRPHAHGPDEHIIFHLKLPECSRNSAPAKELESCINSNIALGKEEGKQHNYPGDSPFTWRSRRHGGSMIMVHADSSRLELLRSRDTVTQQGRKRSFIQRSLFIPAGMVSIGLGCCTTRARSGYPEEGTRPPSIPLHTGPSVVI